MKSNEELVSEIRSGINVKNNYEMLYGQNLGLIRQWCKCYSGIAEIEDLLQESYFSVIRAVEHYVFDKEVAFSTYLRYWIHAGCREYANRCGFAIRFPTGYRQQIIAYKKTYDLLFKGQGREPTRKQIAKAMDIDVVRVAELETFAASTISLDTPIRNDDDVTIKDTIVDDLRLEDDSIDKTFNEERKNKIWGIVDDYTTIKQADILRDLFINNLSLRACGEKYSISGERVRVIRNDALARLRMGKAKMRLAECMEYVDASAYRSGLGNYKSKQFTSQPEYIAIRKQEIEKEYIEGLSEIRTSLLSEKSGN